MEKMLLEHNFLNYLTLKNLDYCSDHENSTDLGGSHQTPGISLPPQLNSLQQLTLGLSSSSSPVGGQE